MLLSAAAAIAYLDRVVISNVVKELQSEIGISDREAGWVLASFVLGYSMMQIPMGRLGDRVGLRFILPGIVVMWSLLTGLTTVVDSLLALCLARRRTTAGGVGAVICPLLGPEVLRMSGWEAVLPVFAGIFFLTAASWLWVDARRPIGKTDG